MLQIKSLSFAYASRTVFHELALDVAAGEHVVIVGDSGSGKSTLLKLIADQHQMVKLADGANSAMVMQQGALLDHLSTIGNLRLVARYMKLENAEEQIQNLLRQLNISKSLYAARVSRLSGGQMRRVAIARALLTDPKLVLFDEPDAGLDIANLESLAGVVSQLSGDLDKACLTVSHNPFYIALVADKVYQLRGGQLQLIADWGKRPGSKQDLFNRQTELQRHLSEKADEVFDQPARKPPRDWPVLSLVKNMPSIITSLVHWPRSLRDELHIGGYGIFLSFISGTMFFALVGLMLGTTTIAVVKMLADSALTGFVSLLISPEKLIDMMGGRFVLYLAPAIGGMLFAARSGSIMSNWLGEMVRGQQVRALRLLNVPPRQYLAAPSLVAIVVSMVASITLFALCVWCGGVYATQLWFDIADPFAAMAVSTYDIRFSLFWPKTLLYSLLVALTVVTLGLADKSTAHQVNIHTTKTIIYSTLIIAMAELVIILT